MTEIQWKSILVRVNARFELSGFKCIRIKKSKPVKLRHIDQLESGDVRPVSLFRILLQGWVTFHVAFLTEDPSVTKISAQYQDFYRSQKKN